MNNLPKTVTRQRRDCDLNPGPTAPESSTLTTRLPSHRFYTVTMRVYRCRFCVSCVFPQLPWVNSIRCAHLMAALIMHACCAEPRIIIHGVCAVRPPTRFAREARMLAHFVMPATRIIRACACGAMHCRGVSITDSVSRLFCSILIARIGNLSMGGYGENSFLALNVPLVPPIWTKF